MNKNAQYLLAKRFRTPSYFIPLLVIGIAQFLITYWHPYVDESRIWTDMLSEFTKTHSIKTLYEIGNFHYHVMWYGDNLRFIQLVGFFLFALPKWVSSLVAVLCFVWMLQATARLAGVWLHKYPYFVISLFSAAFLYPWYEFMIGPVFLLNYAFPAALWATTMSIWIDKEQKMRPFTSFILGLFIGWGHELYAAMLVAGILGAMCFYKEKRGWNGVLLIVGACVHICITLMAPCFQYRSTAVDEMMTPILSRA